MSSNHIDIFQHDFILYTQQTLKDLLNYDSQLCTELTITEILNLPQNLYTRFLFEMSFYLNWQVSEVENYLINLTQRLLFIPNSTLEVDSNSNSTTFTSELEYLFPIVIKNVVEQLTGVKVPTIFGPLVQNLLNCSSEGWKLVQNNIQEYSEDQLRAYYQMLCDKQ
ncbi:Hypothetical_protein [Hexamita inflata]|uniref:Hypothetical_protein n=1 Tax=Hexamita inflata TaxID=28002 RepID=A0AA86PBU3_9EUKA|nr:Hypothetical protein HINF_LOCUS23704 [Hexamita inflata]CAI9961613.1 Hypothetical protein HINF_LOCUS49258 [Hexamita inflata]